MARTTRSSATTATRTEKKNSPQQLSSPPATPAPNAKSIKASKAQSKTSTPANTSRKRSRSTKADAAEDFPHGLAPGLPTPSRDENEQDTSEPSRKRGRRSTKQDTVVEVKQEVVEEASVPATSPKKTKKASYGLTPGTSPYPDYVHPTREECSEVVRLLEKVHGKVEIPEVVPPPSLDYAGCGEVPSVIDALVRTRLSANTTNKNSSTAFRGLVDRFGVLKEGVGKGSVDWDAVRRAPQREVFKAIERGGLADRKSKDIQAILQIAYEENQARKSALESGEEVEGIKQESESEKKEEVEKAGQNVLSLDHLHLLSTEEAINRMLELPGIGPKTASCVALFCLRRPSFAVDTHVFRLCQYLGWVPKTTKKGQPKVDRNTTYSHCDARIPDEFKYKLHYLLIKHGKTCPRCRAITGQSSAGWDEGCPIEHLVKRHGSKKGGQSAKDRKKAKEDAEHGNDEDASEEEDDYIDLN